MARESGEPDGPVERLLRLDDPATGRSVVLEDDGRVAYAYLLARGNIVADVWLYNVLAAPDEVDWSDETHLPFLNPRQFCRDESAPRLGPTTAVRLAWSDRGVEVFIDGVLMARLEDGARPGWSRLAAFAGPLARPLA